MSPPHDWPKVRLWPFRHALRVTKLGAVLVTIGVAGELYVEVASTPAHEKLRQFNNALIFRTQSETAQANGVAAQANARTLREIDARLLIEEKLRTQGPRWILLETGKQQFP